MSARRHEPQIRTSGSGDEVLDVWLPFCSVSGFETDGGRILIVVEGDAAIAGVTPHIKSVFRNVPASNSDRRKPRPSRTTDAVTNLPERAGSVSDELRLSEIKRDERPAVFAGRSLLSGVLTEN